MPSGRRSLVEEVLTLLNWDLVRERYETDPEVRQHGSGRTLRVTGIDETHLEVSTRLWTKTLDREHLERAVVLMEEETLTRRVGEFVEQYGKTVTKEKRTLAARILEDLGYLE